MAVDSRALVDALRPLEAVFANITHATAPVIDGIGKIGQQFQQVLQPLNGSIGALNQFGQSVGQFVSKSNPAEMLRFNMAVEDTMAVIGQALVPVMQVLTDVMRHIGDVLVANQPSIAAFATAIGKLFEAFSPAIESVLAFGGIMADALVPVFEALAPIIRILGEALKPVLAAIGAVAQALASGLATSLKILEPIIKAIADAFVQLVKWLYEGIRELDKLNPFTDRMKNWDEVQADMARRTQATPGASTGAAVRQASFRGIEDVGRQAIIASAMAGGNRKSPELTEMERQTMQLEKMVRLLEAAKDNPLAQIALDPIKGALDTVQRTMGRQTAAMRTG